MQELRHQYVHEGNAIQYKVLKTIGRGKNTRIKQMTKDIEYPSEERHVKMQRISKKLAPYGYDDNEFD